jgi:predicted Zn-ribbon and HTH transcriptional regulator
MKKENKKMRCPVCKSGNIADNSTYKNNGVLGPGRRSWKTNDSRICNDCGVIFKPVKVKFTKSITAVKDSLTTLNYSFEIGV